MKKPRLSDTRDHISAEGLSNGSRLAPAKSVFVVVRGMILAKDLPVALAEVPMAFNQDIKALVPRSSVDPEYLLYALAAQKDALATAISTSAHGTRRMETASLESLLLPLPPKDEQRRIAHVLARLEAAVEVQDRTVRVLRELKAATMAKLFREGLNGELRKQTEIGEIPMSWSVRPCEELCRDITVGIVVQPARYYVSAGIPCFRSFNVRADRLVDHDLVFISHQAHELHKKSRLEAGDVVVVRTGYPGTACVVPERYAESNCIDLLVMRPNHDLLISDYLARFLNSPVARRHVASVQGGLAQQHFNVGALRQMPIALPSLAEQERIAGIGATLDERIVASERAVAGLEVLFSAMLKLLMTARVRMPAGLVDGALSARPSGGLAPEVLDEIVHRVVAAVAPEKIILFGSAARGELRPDSDIDLLVVKRCDDRRQVARGVRACLRGVTPGRGKDVVVVTPEDVERDRDTIGYVIRPALREGRVLYAA